MLSTTKEGHFVDQIKMYNLVCAACEVAAF